MSSHTRFTITESEIAEMIDWIARLPEIGAPLRGPDGPRVRDALGVFAQERVREMQSGPQHEPSGSHTIMPTSYYPLEFLKLDLIDRVRSLR